MRAQFAVFAVLASLSLTGCSAFVPSWNAQPSPIEIDNTEDSENVIEESPVEEQPAPSTPNEPEVPAESGEDSNEEVERETVNVEVISAMAYEDEGLLEVIAQVFDVVEDGGECSLKLLAGDFSTELTVEANRSSNYTQCAPIDIPLSELPGGTAVVSVSYLSELHEGESASVSVVIP